MNASCGPLTRRKFLEARNGDTALSLLNLFKLSKESYFKSNVYALHDFVVTAAYTSSFNCSYSEDLRPLLSSGVGGLPDYEKITDLQRRYRESKVFIWDTQDWGRREVDLAHVVKDAVELKIAVPEAVLGEESHIAELTIADLFG